MNSFQNILSKKITTRIYYLLIVLISFASFLAYSPLYHPHFNSDHGIHVLMSYRFDYPQALFYWGQGRLGSLLPVVSHGFVEYLGIHPLIAISMVNHLFLLTIFFVFSIPIKNLGYKLIFCVFLFFPLFTYNSLLLVGHPYCSQLFAAAMALLFFGKAYQFLNEENASLKNWKIWFYSLFGTFFLVTSIWVSEFSYVFGIFILLFIASNIQFLKKIKTIFLQEKILSVVFIGINIANLDMWFKKLHKYKQFFLNDGQYQHTFKEHDFYDKTFLDNSLDIYLQKKWMIEKMTGGLNFSGEDTTYSWVYWSLILIFACCLVYYKTADLKNPLSIAMIGTSIIGFVLLFYSTWNYRSMYEPRYYTALVIIVIAGLLYLSSGLTKLKIGWVTSGLWIIVILAILKNNSNVIFPIKKSVVDKYKEFAELPEGGLIANYWLVYKVNAVAPYNLTGIPIQNDAQRNKHMIDEVFEKPIIYIIKNDFLDMNQPMPDSLIQFNRVLVKIEKEERKIDELTFGVYTKAK